MKNKTILGMKVKCEMGTEYKKNHIGFICPRVIHVS
jgi:hypothetical protein